jgi:hypothetical protein
LAQQALEQSTTDNKITWAIIRQHTNDVRVKLSSMKFEVCFKCFILSSQQEFFLDKSNFMIICNMNLCVLQWQDPAQGQDKVVASYKALYEEIQTSFRTLSEK